MLGRMARIGHNDSVCNLKIPHGSPFLGLEGSQEMKRLLTACSLTAVLGLAAGCAVEEPDLEEDMTEIAKLAPLTPPLTDSTNIYSDSDGAAALGQRLFFEKSYAAALTVGDDGMNGSPGAVGEKGKLACASCHDPNAWFIDTRTKPNNVSLGVAYTPRNAPSLVNAAYYKWFGWSGKQDSLWMQGAQGAESRDNFAGNRLFYTHMMYRKYKDDYNRVFPIPLDPALDPAAPDAARFPPSGKPKSNPQDPDGPWEMMAPADREVVNTIMANWGKAIAAYERRLISLNAPLDRYASGDKSALSSKAVRGLKLFVGKAGCIGCHTGKHFSDDSFHVTGVPQKVGLRVPDIDEGHFADVGGLLKSTFNGAGAFSDDAAAGMKKLSEAATDEQEKGKFRTKSLRQIGATGPYMHNGSMATLAEIVAFYNRGGASEGFSGTKDALMVPLNLTAEEQSDIVEFLQTGLTGDPIPAPLREDTAVP
jgi:cytochrome c peroxidase